ncbi:MAG: hypothetical protein LBV12_08765 [Puniceicoccales bacterium]|jgi:hypothetical protein|nr:hypothetical protein [Puniceicoccales bacterium]
MDDEVLLGSMFQLTGNIGNNVWFRYGKVRFPQNVPQGVQHNPANPYDLPFGWF